MELELFQAPLEPLQAPLIIDCMINLYMFANDARMVEEEGQRTYWIRSTLQLELVAEMPLAVTGIF